MSWLAQASVWQLLAAGQLLISMAVYLPSLVAALVRRFGSTRAEVTREDLAITALKPLRGLDPSLEANLESFARLSAADGFEILLVLDDAHDEALPVARRLADRHPQRVKVLIGTTPGVMNPKVASLLYALPHAKNPLLWVTDSNTETSDEHFRAQVAEWKALQVNGRQPTLIHAPIAAVGGTGLGARFERLQLATYNSVNAETTLMAGIDAVVGKSLLFHRDDFAAVGGLESFGTAGGEDFLMGRAFHEAGVVRCSRRATRQVLGEHVTGLDFWRRQARWAKVRRGMSQVTFATLEPFTYFAVPMVWLALGLLPWEAVAGVLALKSIGDSLLLVAMVGEGRLGDLLVMPLKEVVLLTAWASAFFTREVNWRGRRLTVKSGGDYTVADPDSMVEPH